MTHYFRICPTNRLLIEWQLANGRWGFYRVCDSPADAKRSLRVLRGEEAPANEQMDLLAINEEMV